MNWAKKFGQAANLLTIVFGMGIPTAAVKRPKGFTITSFHARKRKSSNPLVPSYWLDNERWVFIMVSWRMPVGTNHENPPWCNLYFETNSCLWTFFWDFKDPNRDPFFSFPSKEKDMSILISVDEGGHGFYFLNN